jgi:hypothetical protein
MIKTNYLIVHLLLLLSCHQNSGNNPSNTSSNSNQEDATFFPVTDFFKGQLVEIRERGIAPLKFSTINNLTDSIWIKMDSLEAVFHDFITTSIDSVSLAKYYSGKKFYDQTLGLITLTYEANQQLPQDIPWLSWNVYIDPQKGDVMKIYLVKRESQYKTLQLSWNCKTHCSITGITERSIPDSSFISRKETIKWKY